MICRLSYPFQAFPGFSIIISPSERPVWNVPADACAQPRFLGIRSSKNVSLRQQILKTNPFKWFSVNIDSIHLLKILFGLAVHCYRFHNFYHN